MLEGIEPGEGLRILLEAFHLSAHQFGGYLIFLRGGDARIPSPDYLPQKVFLHEDEAEIVRRILKAPPFYVVESGNPTGPESPEPITYREPEVCMPRALTSA